MQHRSEIAAHWGPFRVQPATSSCWRSSRMQRSPPRVAPTSRWVS